MTTMNNVPDIERNYPGNPLLQANIYRLIRPHPGMWLANPHSTACPFSNESMASIDSSSFDVLICIVRLLISYGFAIETVSDPSQSDLTPTEAEMALMHVVGKDLGWKQEDDWRLKAYLVVKLGIPLVRQSSGTLINLPTLQQLIQHPRLPNIFIRNLQFRIISHKYIFDDQGEYRLKEKPPLDPLIESENILRFTNSQTPSEFLTSYFQSNTNIQMLSRRPKFLRFEYDVHGRGMNITGLQTIQFTIPEVVGEDKYVRQEATYQLIAVVRTTAGKRNSIRIYLEGSELVPGEVGDFKQKEPEIIEEGRRWSVEEEGSYMLFYSRCKLDKGDSLDWVGRDVKEYEDRKWQ